MGYTLGRKSDLPLASDSWSRGEISVSHEIYANPFFSLSQECDRWYPKDGEEQGREIMWGEICTNKGKVCSNQDGHIKLEEKGNP